MALVLTILGFAAAMGVPAFVTAIVESAASKIRPSSSPLWSTSHSHTSMPVGLACGGRSRRPSMKQCWRFVDQRRLIPSCFD